MNLLDFYPPLVSWQNAVPDQFRKGDEHGEHTTRVPWNLKVPAQRNSEIIFLTEHVRSDDLSARILFGKKSTSFHLVNNIFTHAKDRLQSGYDIELPKTAARWSALSFHTFRTYTIKTLSERTAINTEMAKRAKAFIKEFGTPDCLVVCFSPYLASLLNPEVKSYHFGNPVPWGKRTLLPTYPIFSALEFYRESKYNDSEDFEQADKTINQANLIGVTIHHLCSGLARENLHSIAEVEANPVLIRTLDGLDSCLSKLAKEPMLSYDIETKSLARIGNPIYTIQMGSSRDSSFVIPLAHPSSPLAVTHKTLEEAKVRIRNFLLNLKPKLIGQNIQFDLAVTRSFFNIPWVDTQVWDTGLAELCLDENILASFDAINQSALAFSNICAGYGNFFYFEKEGFSKENRANITNVNIAEDKGFLEYAAMDAQLLHAVVEQQVARASVLECVIQGKRQSYKKPYIRYVLKQVSNNVQVLAHMEGNGHLMDVPHLQWLKSKESPIVQIRKKMADELKAMPSAQKANKILLKREGYPTGNSLFGKDPWILKLSKPSHKQVLFFEVLKLEGLSVGKKGDFQVDAIFQKTYKDVPEVGVFTRIAKLDKLMSSYVGQFLRKLDEDTESKIDGRLRAEFKLLTVTGRSISRNPSFQQLPKRTAEAKLILRSFVAPPGFFLVEPDFSTHEVRVWDFQTGDVNLADLFNRGRLLRKKWRETEDPSVKERLLYEGDPHRINAQTFLGAKTPDEIKAARDATKGVGFGLLYGMANTTLAANIKKDQEFTDNLVEAYFRQFPKASKWLKDVVKEAKKYLAATSVLGRRRNLSAYLAGINRLSNDLDRRAKNSPIQGMGADLGHTAAWLFLKEFRTFLINEGVISWSDNVPFAISMMVHDSTRKEIMYRYVLAAIQIYQWVAVEGVRRYYQKNFEVEFLTQLEVEFAIGPHGAALKTWDWSETHLKEILQQGVEEQLKVYPSMDVKEALRELSYPRRDKKLRTFLDTHYPFFPERGEGGFTPD